MQYPAHKRTGALYWLIPISIYLYLSISGLNWDRVSDYPGVPLDPDSGEMITGLNYVNQRDYSNGFKNYPQGYGIPLSIIYEGYLRIRVMFGDKEAEKWIYDEDSPAARSNMRATNSKFESMSGRFQNNIIFLTRTVSSGAILATVIIIFELAKSYYGGLSAGFGSALLTISAYPILLYSQIMKYPAFQMLSFVVSFYLICSLMQKRSLRHYIYCGIATGYAISVIFYNGIALFILFFAHIRIITDENRNVTIHRKISLILSSRAIWSAIGICGITFGLMNPAIFADFQRGLRGILGWAYSLTLSRRGDLLLTDQFSGPFSFVQHINSDFGTPIAAIIVFSSFGAWLPKGNDHMKLAGFGLIAYLLFYSASNIHQSYLLANAVPLAILILVQIMLNTYLSYPKRAIHIGIVIIFMVMSIPGIKRSFFQNAINRSLESTGIAANQFLLSLYPEGTRVITDCDMRVRDRAKKNEYIGLNLYPGSSMGLATSLSDIFPVSPDFLDSDYALVGAWSDELRVMKLHHTYKKKDSSVPSNTREIDLLKHTIQSLYDLLEMNAKLVKKFPGRREGMDQINLHGYKFRGFSLNDISTFYGKIDAKLAYGEHLRLYRLTRQFKEKLLSEISCDPITPDAYQNDLNQHHVDIKGIYMKSLRISERGDNGYRASITWQIEERIPLIMGKLFLTFYNDNYLLEKRVTWNKVMTGLMGQTWVKEWNPTIRVQSKDIKGQQFITKHDIDHFDSLIDGTYSIYIGSFNQFRIKKHVVGKLVIQNKGRRETGIL